MLTTYAQMNIIRTRERKIINLKRCTEEDKMKTLKVKSLLFALAFFLSLFTAYANASVSDDMNDSNVFNLHDIISSLKVLAGMTPSSDVHKRSVENSSEKIGVKEAIYIFQNTNGMSRRFRNAARNAAASHTACFMKVTHGTGAINEQVKLEIILEGNGVAGVAFTIEYGPHLILNTVESDFFDTFVSQGFSSEDGLDGNGTADGYVQPLVYDTDEAVGGTKIAAAHHYAGGSDGDVLFTLFFSLKSGASPGTYPINIKPTVLNNTDAGYSAEGEAIDMLIGIDGDTYPVLINSEVNENGYSAHVEPGSVTFISGKRYEPNAEDEPVSDIAATLGDAILALRALAGMSGDGINLELDVSKDGKIGPEDPVYILKFIADSQSGDEITPLQSEKTRIASPDVSESDLGELVAGNTDFAINFYHAIAEGDENIFFSPHSISLALAMTYAGARKETASQMAGTLHFTLFQENLHPAFNALDIELISRGKNAQGQDGEGFRLNIANSIWGQKDYSFLPSFLDTLAENYGAGLNLLDFSSAPDASRVIINNWVSDKTEEKIKDLIPEGSISSATRLVLTNAIYFNAAWKFPFKEELTQNAPFHLADGGEVTVPMMSMPEAERFGFTEGDEYQAVEVRYDGNELSMVILIPDAGQFAAFETSLTKDRFDSISEALELTNMNLELPKFRHESASISIKDMLSEMGMPAAFGGDADFSGMNGKCGLFISDVIHKAYVAVDEAGTEAAAATAVIMNESAAMPPDRRLTVDRPFIFLIRDIRTKAILFIGRIVNPA